MTTMKNYLLMAALCCLAISTQAATRVAVVDVGPQEKVPPAFLDLMLVGLGNQPQLALLERTELAKLLREQTLSLRMGEPVKSADAVKAGQLWAVDAFLMLEAGKASDKKEIPVRVRLVDAHYGLKLWDGSILLSPDTAKYQESIDLVVKRSVQKLALLSRGSTGVVLVAVAPVRSEEMSTRWDWLKDPLTVGIEQNIGVTPGFLLVERERTRSLIDERQVTAGLPEALRASAVFVDSSFKINREKGPDVVTLQLRCRRGGSTLLETTVDGTVSNTVALCRNAAREVATKLGVKPADNSMAAQQEAAMLAAEAQVAGREASVASIENDQERNVAASHRAVSLAEAALAMVPDSCDYQRLLITTPVPSHPSMDELVADTQLRLPVALRVLQHCPPGPTRFADVSAFLHNFLNRWDMAQRNNPQARHHEAFNDLSREFWDLWQTFYEKSPAWRDEAFDEGQRAFTLCSTVDQAVDFHRKAVEYAAAKNPSNPEMGSFFLLGLLADPLARPKIIAFMDELMTSTNPAVRYLGLKWGVVIYGSRSSEYYNLQPDEARAQAIAKEHVALMKSGKFRSLDAWHTVAACKFSNDENVNDEKLARIFEDIVNYGIQENLYDDSLAEMTAGRLERAGKGQEAVVFFVRYIATLPAGKGNKPKLETKLRDLQRRVPDLPDSPPTVAAANEFHVKKLLVLTESAAMKSDTKRRVGLRLFMQGNVAVIVYFYDEAAEHGYGVLRFDMDRLQVVSDQRAGPNARMKYMKLNNQFFYAGPAVASDGRDVFVGHTTEGILAFPSDGQPRLLNEENGLASQRVWMLAALDGKIYAMIGSPLTETGLMEVDWKTNISSRILASERGTSSESALAGRGISGILADDQRHLLWVVSRERSNGTVALLTYAPRDHQVEFKRKDLSGGGDFFMRWMGKEILLWQHGTSWTLNSDTVEGQANYGNSSQALPCRKQPNGVHWHMPEANFPPRCLTFIGNELMALQGRELLWFHNGMPEPVHALDLFFSKEIAKDIYIRELAATQHGLLMLSEDGLYLVPEIKAPTQPTATAASK